MATSLYRAALARPVLQTCLACQWRAFSASPRQLADPSSPKPPAPAPAPAQTPTAGGDGGPQSQFANVPRAYGKRAEEFTPRPLSRPIGMAQAPRIGENSGMDHRSLQQRRDDFVNYEKHLRKREQLKQKMAKPYFREWTNMQFHKGKTFLAPPRPFKADYSLYFPNLVGKTLSKELRTAQDTTPTLAGKATVVSMFSSVWAENQAQTFVSKEANPALHEVITNSGGKAQIVQINVEENTLKAALIQMFMGSLRKRVGESNWDKYFIVRKGLTDEICESIGVLNSKVGYTYLVDHNCRIRWAGSGPSEPEEREGLVKGVQRVLVEMEKEAELNQLAAEMDTTVEAVEEQLAARGQL